MGNEDNGIGQLIIIVGFWGGFIIYPVLQFIAIKKTFGIWRIFAYIPLIIMTIVFIFTVVSLYQASNLWPIILIFVAPFIIVYLIALLFIHMFFMRNKIVIKNHTMIKSAHK